MVKIKEFKIHWEQRNFINTFRCWIYLKYNTARHYQLKNIYLQSKRCQILFAMPLKLKLNYLYLNRYISYFSYTPIEAIISSNLSCQYAHFTLVNGHNNNFLLKVAPVRGISESDSLQLRFPRCYCWTAQLVRI